MRSTKLSARSIAVIAAAGLVLSACGGGEGDDSNDSGSGSSGEGGGEGGKFSVFASQPEKDLIPGDTTETGGSAFVNAMWTGLVTYDPETGARTEDGVAESFESDDNKTWTIKLKDGWTFHDGTPVNADSFIKAWNDTALSTNGYGGSYFMKSIVGYKDLQAKTEGEGDEKKVVEEPKSTEMSGLQKVDDLTFTVELEEPFAQFPLTTGYNAFFPMPEAYFADKEAFGKMPIGNGPWKAKTEFVDRQGMTLERFDEYAGEKTKADEVEFKIYDEIQTGYLDVQGGSLDIASVPPDSMETVEDEFGDKYVSRESSSFTYLGFPTYDERYANKEVRQALSMAIDRQAVSDAIFGGTRAPAMAAVAPVVEGYREDACNYCEFDAEAAKAKLDASGFDKSQPIELWFNAGAGHEEWVQAVGTMWKQNLGVEFVLKGDLQFAQYLPKLDEQGMTGPFRLGWVMDYPSMQNYLEPLYSTAALPPAGSNGTFFTNDEFDKLIAEGNRAATDAEAVAKYQEAEDIILEEMPIIPMFFGLSQAVHSDRISNVKIDPFGNYILDKVEVNS